MGEGEWSMMEKGGGWFPPKSVYPTSGKEEKDRSQFCNEHKKKRGGRHVHNGCVGTRHPSPRALRLAVEFLLLSHHLQEKIAEALNIF